MCRANKIAEKWEKKKHQRAREKEGNRGSNRKKMYCPLR